MAVIDLGTVLSRISTRTAGRTEADVQSDVRLILLHGELELQDEDLNVALESQVGDGRRIDVEAGCAVIECKKDLRNQKLRLKAVEQLAGYMKHRTEQTDQRYAGVLTDGAEWYLYVLRDDEAVQVSYLKVDAGNPDVDGLKVWLEGVLATRTHIKPTPLEIQRRLGAGTPSYALDRASLTALYDDCRHDEEVGVKRMLWARLLTTAFGSAFENNDRLFIEHTYLVIVAELIAHEVVGLGLEHLDNATSTTEVLSGKLFSKVGIAGVVEDDFFDWVVKAPGGDQFVRNLARRIARFQWSGEVEHDVLKFLYESVVSAEERHSLGEYYTPDWLAEAVVKQVATSPLTDRVLDPACGSGTFIFAAVRNYLQAADAAGVSNAEAVETVVQRVFGSDVHPVAVTLARVTYLLAIGLDRLQDRGPIRIPVSVGDSLQWSQADEDLFSGGELVVKTLDGAELFASELRWPHSVASSDHLFDALVTDLADRATSRNRGDKPLPITAILNRHKVAQEDRPTIEQTYRTLCRLHDDGRNHIWGYYVRNLARPYWLSLPENRPDVLVGNPPWLSYRFMTDDMKQRFRDDTQARNLGTRAALATSQDLSGYFVARSVELYLRDKGRFGFVMPLAAISRPHFEGFRKGNYDTALQGTRVSFDRPWDIHAVKPLVFPMPASVVFGSKTQAPKAMSDRALAWTGKLPNGGRTTWQESESKLVATDVKIDRPTGTSASPYGAKFKQGATIVPRTLMTVETVSAGPLGVVRGTQRVRSLRSSDDKEPWKSLESREGMVEDQFIFPFHYGKTLAPFRMLAPLKTVIPWDGEHMLEMGEPGLDAHPGFADWWSNANSLWVSKGKNKMTLTQRANYQRTLENQFPFPEHRVVYNRSGTRLTAAYVPERNAVIDTKLYWGAVNSRREADYLCAIFNSMTMTELVNPVQGKGHFGPRDFYGLPFEFPIPVFDAQDDLHVELAEVGGKSAELANSIEMAENVSFVVARKTINLALDEAGISAQLNELVKQLLLY